MIGLQYFALAKRTQREMKRTYWQTGILRNGLKKDRMVWLAERWRETLPTVKTINFHNLLDT